jgi:protein TonB
MTRVCVCPEARVRSRLASLTLHIAALAGVIAVTHHAVPPPTLDEPAVAVVFQTTEPPPVAPPAELPPQPLVPSIAPAPEPPPPARPSVPETELVPPPPPRDLQPPTRPPHVMHTTVVPRPSPRLSLSPPLTPALPGARAATPSAVPLTAPAPVVPQTVDVSWQASVTGWLASHKTYPDEARQRGEEGRVVVRFTIERSGHVVDAGIVVASGSTPLDSAAMALVRGASFPPFPSSMPQERITITTAVHYTLR